MSTPEPIAPWQLGRLHETDNLKQIRRLLQHPDVLHLRWRSDYTQHTATAELVKGQYTIQVLKLPNAFHIHLIPHAYNDATDHPHTHLTHTSTYIAGPDPDTNKIQMFELTNITDQVELTPIALQHLSTICKQAQCYDPFDL